MPMPASTNQVAESTRRPGGSAHDDGERITRLDGLPDRDVQRLHGPADGGDDGTNDLIVSDLIRRNELQVWFVSEHVVDAPLTQAD